MRDKWGLAFKSPRLVGLKKFKTCKYFIMTKFIRGVIKGMRDIFLVKDEIKKEK